MNISYPARFLFILLGFFLLILLIWDVYLFLTPAKTNFLNYFYNVGYGLLFILSAAVAVYSRRFIGGATNLGGSFIFIGLASFFYGIGLFAWSYYNLIAKIEVPYPSLADIFFILFYPVMLIGIVQTIKIFSFQITKRVLLEVAIAGLFISSAVLYLTHPDIFGDLNIINKVLNLLYPLFDSILITMVYLLIRISSGKIYGSIFFLIAALSCQAAGDILFTLRTIDGTYWNGGIADLFFTLSAFFIGIAIIDITKKMQQPA